MQFKLLFEGNDLGLPAKIEFDARDTSSAMQIARSLIRKRPASLWSGNTRLRIPEESST